ncbi:MAG: hypothetical protein QXR18_06985 [Pyrobaculum sp.]
MAAYLQYQQEAFYTIAVPKYGGEKTEMTLHKKIYPIDQVYVKKMEMAVAHELFRHGAKFYYFKTS